MKYLVTGGCGFLGSNIADKLMKEGQEVIVFDNLFRFGSEKNLEWLRKSPMCRYIHGDVRNREDIENVIREEKPDVIYHLAGQVAMTTSIKNPRVDFEINAMGSFNVLDSVRKYSPATVVIYSSTNKVYGDIEWTPYEETDKRYIATKFPNGFPETITLDFHSPYGTSKGAADQYMLDYARIFGINTVVFRHSSMYGSRQFATYDQGWIGWFCQQAVEQKTGKLKEPFTISGNGKQVRDVLYVDDLLALYTAAVTHIDKIKGNAFNIGGGVENSLSLLELFDLLASEIGMPLEFRKLPPRESDQRVFIADLTKIQSMTGWKPMIDKRTGIHKMLQWIETMGK